MGVLREIDYNHLLSPASGISRTATLVVAANDSTAKCKSQADYVCDGTSDDVQIQAAVDALPSGGGKVTLLEGTFTLSNAISRAIDNITIQGQGESTILNLDAAAAVIDAGSQSGWFLLDFNTDAGGIDISSATNSASRYWKNGTLEYGFGVTGLTMPAFTLGDKVRTTILLDSNEANVNFVLGLVLAPSNYATETVVGRFRLKPNATVAVTGDKAQAGLEGEVYFQATNDQNWATHALHAVGSWLGVASGATGTIDNLYGFRSSAAIAAMTVANLAHMYIHDATGDGIVTKQRGIHFESLTKGATSNFEISGAGAIRIAPSGDEDDYFTFATTSGVPTITATGSYLKVASQLVVALQLDFDTATSYISSYNADNAVLVFRGRYNTVGVAEVARIQGAADPYFGIGGSQQFKFYNSGIADFGGYVKLHITDTDGTVEGQIWYDASEDKLKFKTAAGVETITSA